jgi:hypothetical protein
MQNKSYMCGSVGSFRTDSAQLDGYAATSSQWHKMAESDMIPRMSDHERQLFESILRCSSRYLEFGSGGSTYLASSLVGESIISVDSSAEWLDRVRQACEAGSNLTRPTLLYVDIGPTVEWGFPSDRGTRERWRDYHGSLWARPECSDADLYMVDGRFRVACFMQILLHSRRDALIMIHDFNLRSEYHVVKEVAREIAVSGGLSIFLRRSDRNETRVSEILAAHEYDPA